MNDYVIKIPKNLARLGDLVLVPRKEYESYLEFKKFKEFKPTLRQKNALKSAELNLKKGKTLSINELTRKLGVAY